MFDRAAQPEDDRKHCSPEGHKNCFNPLQLCRDGDLIAAARYARDLRARITKAAKLGFRVELDEVSVIYQSPEPCVGDNHSFVERLSPSNGYQLIPGLFSSPFEHPFAVAPDLESARSLKVTPFLIRMGQTGQSEFVIVKVYDLLSADLAVFEAAVDVRSLGSVTAPIKSAMAERLDAHRRSLEEIASYKSQRGEVNEGAGPRYVLQRGSRHRTLEEKESAAKFCESLVYANLSATPEGAHWRQGVAQVYLKPSDLCDDYSLKIEGHGLSLQVGILQCSLSSRLLPEEVTRYCDRFGNNISLLETVNVTPREGCAAILPYLAIEIQPPMQLAVDSSSSDPILFHFDLSPLGGTTVMGCFEIVPRVPVGEHRGLRIYASETLLRSASIEFEMFDTFIDAVHELERFLGAPQDCCTTSLLLRDQGEGAGGTAQVDGMAQQRVIEVAPKLFRYWPQFAPLLATHEAAHIVDIALGESLSGGEVAEFFKDAPREFFNQISEHHWYPDATEGGHAWDDPKELLASFVNSLTFARFIEVKLTQDRAFACQYQRCLIALENNLLACERISRNAPVFQRISEMHERIHALLAADNPSLA